MEESLEELRFVAAHTAPPPIGNLIADVRLPDVPPLLWHVRVPL